ncbi:MAG: hypothetical protein GIW99_11895 [Candidatus Eremiobacteraeota bacterium]|nr:hypothetical protein [Candidatus Eremiobacteraeota bacterium]MBC5828362.1 hypothetical protein [Candidatus Eremiobacteraeota bacterium]
MRSHRDYERLREDLRRRFAFVGDVSVYYFLFRVGERVPPFSEWASTVKGNHPRVREMVEVAAVTPESQQPKQ